MEFAGEILRRLKAEGISTLLQTCGFFSMNELDRWLYPWLDQIYFDLKIADADLHQQYCGATNRSILDNFRTLAGRANAGGVPVLPRIPLIPGLTLTAANLRAWSQFLQACSITQVQLLPFHPFWKEKNSMLGFDGRADGLDKFGETPATASFDAARAQFAAAGISIL